MLSPVHSVVEKCDCRRKRRLLPKTARQRRQSPKSATVVASVDRLLVLKAIKIGYGYTYIRMDSYTNQTATDSSLRRRGMACIDRQHNFNHEPF